MWKLVYYTISQKVFCCEITLWCKTWKLHVHVIFCNLFEAPWAAWTTLFIVLVLIQPNPTHPPMPTPTPWPTFRYLWLVLAVEESMRQGRISTRQKPYSPRRETHALLICTPASLAVWHTHTNVCMAIFVGTLIDIMLSQTLTLNLTIQNNYLNLTITVSLT